MLIEFLRERGHRIYRPAIVTETDGATHIEEYEEAYAQSEGTLTCSVERISGQESFCAAYHKDCPDKKLLTEYPASFEVGVDSGQAGIFDRAHYQDASTVASVPDPIYKKDPWYSACCHQTRKAEHQ